MNANNKHLRKQILSNKNLAITCVIPCFNEEKIITIFLTELVNKLQLITNNFQLIIIDDGSEDNTAKQIHSFKQTHLNLNNQIKTIQLSRNFGKEHALFAGIEYIARNVMNSNNSCNYYDNYYYNHVYNNDKVFILLDADLQHPINLIPTMLEYWIDGFDIVYGIQNNRPTESWLKKALTKSFYTTMLYITKINIVPNAGDFRLLDEKVLLALAQCKETNRFTKGLYVWIGFPSYGIEFTAQPRLAGKSTFGFKKLANLAITGMISFSEIPLRVWGLIGLVMSSLSFLYAIFIIIKTMVCGINIPGYLSVMVAIIFFCGIQLISIGILGEYIARIFNEVKKRPNYIIKNVF